MKSSSLPIFMIACFASTTALADKDIFKDNFDNGLSDKWKVVNMKKEDYRIRDGALEIKVQPGKKKKDAPRIEVTLDFASGDTVIGSVEVTLLDKFTEEGESAGIYLMDEQGFEFKGVKQLIKGKMVYDPGRIEFTGESGKEDDFSKYVEHHTEVKEAKAPLRIISDRGYAYYQVGPLKKGKPYLNFFHSAINPKTGGRGFSLIAFGAGEGQEHWVRFDNFKAYYRR